MTPAEWFAEFCRRMGWPASSTNLAILDEWARLEGMYSTVGLSFGRGFNPFMTTMPGGESALDIGFGTGWWNREGVRMYASPEAGLAATAATFRTGNGPQWYGPLDEALRTETWNAGVLRSWQIWINGPNSRPDVEGYATVLSDFAKARWAAQAPAGAPVTREEMDTAMLALFAGKEQVGARPTREARIEYAWARARDIADGKAVSLVELVGAIQAGTVADHTHAVSLSIGGVR